MNHYCLYPKTFARVEIYFFEDFPQNLILTILGFANFFHNSTFIQTYIFSRFSKFQNSTKFFLR